MISIRMWAFLWNYAALQSIHIELPSNGQDEIWFGLRCHCAKQCHWSDSFERRSNARSNWTSLLGAPPWSFRKDFKAGITYHNLDASLELTDSTLNSLSSIMGQRTLRHLDLTISDAVIGKLEWPSECFIEHLVWEGWYWKVGSSMTLSKWILTLPQLRWLHYQRWIAKRREISLELLIMLVYYTC